MLKQSTSLDGYKHLLVYKKSDELLAGTTTFTSHFPRVISRLIEQMDSSARSVKANIVEGWKRNATHEYYTFLGYAIASNAELLEDYLDICLGRYEEKGIKGIERGEKGKTDIPISSLSHSKPFAPVSPFAPRKPISATPPLGSSRPFPPFSSPSSAKEWLEKLRFYPLDVTLPASVQLYLRCKEIDMLLQKLQESLLERMKEKKTLSEPDRMRLVREEKKKKEDEAERWQKEEMARMNLVVTAHGLKKKDEAERLGLVWWYYGDPEK